jgi:hypothetical protein
VDYTIRRFQHYDEVEVAGTKMIHAFQGPTALDIKVSGEEDDMRTEIGRLGSLAPHVWTTGMLQVVMPNHFGTIGLYRLQIKGRVVEMSAKMSKKPLEEADDEHEDPEKEGGQQPQDDPQKEKHPDQKDLDGMD